MSTPDAGQTPPGTPTRAAGSAARDAVARLRQRIRRTAVLEVLLAGVAAVLVAMLALALIDYLLRLPPWLRFGLLAAGVAGLAVGVRSRLLPAWRLRPSLTSLALRLEDLPSGRAAGLRSVLASGLALADEPTHADEPPEIVSLRRAAAAEADRRVARFDPRPLVSRRMLAHHGVSATLAVAAAGAITIADPALAGTAAKRVLLPLSDAAWPSRYQVEHTDAPAAHPIGVSLPVRALVTKTAREMGQTPVSVVYRVSDSEDRGEWRREKMTPQHYDATAGGETYERLIEPGRVTLADTEDTARFEYWFETPDDRTPTRSVLLVESPAIEGVRTEIEPPAYAAGVLGGWLDGEAPAGPGTREGLLIAPVLAGSAVEVAIELNKPAELIGGAGLTPIDPDGTAVPIETEVSGRTATLRLTPTEPGRIRFRVRDEHGLESLDDTVIRIDVLRDMPPSVAVITPPRDESVVATAVVELVGEAKDDVGLVSVGLEAFRAIVPGGEERSSGAEPEREDRAFELAQHPTADRRAETSASVDLSRLGLRAGDELWVHALATDGYDLGGDSHGVQRSEPRRLRIISESDLIDEVLADLAGARRTAIRLDAQQAEIEAEARDAHEAGEPAGGELARRQATVGGTLARIGDTIESAQDRLSRNGLNDESLGRMLDDAMRAADRGQSASQAAESSLGGSAAEQSPEKLGDALEASDALRRSLEDLARSLDRGEDAWAVRRALESLLSDQSDVREQTAEAGAETIGRRADELDEQEQSVLDAIAQRQLELAERARDVLDELEEKADESAETDAGQSSALRAASRRGREQGVAQQLQQAADAIRQNRAADAGRAQQAAEEQIREMLNDLEDAERQRDAELRRALLSLVESIEGLIALQEEQIAGLDAGANGEALRQIGIRLNRNTFAVIDEALASPETGTVAGPLRAAAEHQTAVIGVLGDEPFNAADAAENARAGLEDLQAALEIAEESLEDAERREVERRKQELSAAYETQLVRQVDLRDQAEPLAGGRLSRRDRQTVREIGATQTEVRDALASLPTEYPEITDAGIFRLAHERLDDALTAVSETLTAGRIGRVEIARQNSSITLLQGLIDALDDQQNQDDDNFSEGSGEGGGGGGSGGEPELIPPLAELTLLKTLQQDLYDQTRAAAETDNPNGAADTIAAQQRELADHAAQLLESMQDQGQPSPIPGGPPAPDGEPESGPSDSPDTAEGEDTE